ncbi:MAG: CHASE2 domain-containing protein [Verrucomicrobiae bacterium]|nr:CHASE2 domain-containing protein [Verrucomicrobiae bacterium]
MMTLFARLFPERQRRDFLRSLFVVCAIGLLLLVTPLGRPWGRWSFDLPIAFRTGKPISNFALVYVDEKSIQELADPGEVLPPRRHYAHLLDRLKGDGAKLAVFDLVFDQPSKDPEDDSLFARAMTNYGRVVLGGFVERTGSIDGQADEVHAPTTNGLRSAAVAWGLLNLELDSGDGVVRRMYAGNDLHTNIGWTVASALLAPVTQTGHGRLQPRWINYLGRSIPAYSLSQVLTSNGVSQGSFRDRIVVVGSRIAVPPVGSSRWEVRDIFETPLSRFSGRLTPGAEVHATIITNLLDGSWLRRMPPWAEALGVLLLGAGFAWVTTVPRLGRALVATATMVILIAVGSIWLQLSGRVWWDWLIPAAVQAPVACLMAVVAGYGRALRPDVHYHAFLSYRRESGAQTARLIYNELRQRGYRVFLDVEELGSQRFDERLLREVRRTPAFILILDPGALDRCVSDRDWVRKEVALALSLDKNVIPLALSGFNFPSPETLPADLARLPAYNTVRYSHEFFSATINKLIEFMGHPQQRGTDQSSQ